MNHRFRFTAEKIAKRIALARRHRFQDYSPLALFRFESLADAAASPSETSTHLPEVPPGTYWAGVNEHFALHSNFDLDPNWTAPALWLPLGHIGDIFNHPEALICIDGRKFGSADRYHHTIALQGLAPGPHGLTLHGWTGWAGWPPDPSVQDRLLMPECATAELNPALETLLVHAECALQTAQLPQQDPAIRTGILDALDGAFLVLDTREPGSAAFHASATTAFAALSDGLRAAGAPSEQKLHGIGHAHMDIGYLWPVAESRAKNARTYSNVLRLMERHQDFRFSHSQPQLYAMTWKDHPEIFEGIQARVAEGRWEVMGGMWVEPDTNIPGAEALVRQILLGRTWVRETFGEIETPVLWLPDTFGFSWCLPQLMAAAGLKLLITNKLNWNQHTRVPATTFLWEGLDGSRVPVHVLSTPRAVEHLPFPTNYKSDLTAAEVQGTWDNAVAPVMDTLPICFGYGDGGGGPTDALIVKAQAFAQMPGVPQLSKARVSDVLKKVDQVIPQLPVWKDELYLEGHRGVLTGQGWIKRANRRAEARLHRAELLLVMTGALKMPTEMTRAWQLLCLCQFHDIITGTAIPEVMDEARACFAQINQICEEVEARALGLTDQKASLAVLNPSPLPRHSLGLIESDPPDGVIAQSVAEGTLIDLPPLQAYETARVQPSGAVNTPTITRDGAGIILENPYTLAVIGADGTIASLHDKEADRALLMDNQRGNQLWAFEDRPLVWDAWDIEPYFEDRAEEITGLRSMEIIETGPLRVAVRIERTYRNSRIVQHIRLYDRSPRLEFATEIDWHDSHVLLKAAFPLSVTSDRATYDIQWGQIERPTTRETERDASRFEVAAQKWAAIHDGNYAVAILNDAKYGYDTCGHMMRVTLLKSSTSPDPNADQGHHAFTYAIMGQAGDGFGSIRAEAEAMNNPPMILPSLDRLQVPAMSNAPNVIVQTVKPSENGEGFIIRLREAEGVPTLADITFPDDHKDLRAIDLLEAPIDAPTPTNGAIKFKPFEIKSFRVMP